MIVKKIIFDKLKWNEDMKILYTAFNGKNNSSKILLDTISNVDKLYLKNSFHTSVTQLEENILIMI